MQLNKRKADYNQLSLYQKMNNNYIYNYEYYSKEY
jgi:hypothetical protein